MQTIPLTRGQFTFVDDEDYDWLSQFKWMAVWLRSTQKFAAARDVVLTDVQRGGDRKTDVFRKGNLGKQPKIKIYMHRLIMGVVGKEVVDHKDHDPLNNQRTNLRICNRFQNGTNRERIKNPLGFKGVWKNGNGFSARIQANGQHVHLGTFRTALEAAQAYDKAALRLHGEFASPNMEVSECRRS